MRTVFSVAIELREKLGCVGVVVDAKPGAENYYSHQGFVELEVVEGALEERPAPKAVFLPLLGNPCRRFALREKRSAATDRIYPDQARGETPNLLLPLRLVIRTTRVGWLCWLGYLDG